MDASVVCSVAFINAIIGYLQEAKAEKAIEALAKMVVTEATVRRGGEKVRIPSAQLVPGDVVLLQSGDRVPTDLRLLLRRNLHIEEAVLTGESLPAEKRTEPLPADTILADRTNLAFTYLPLMNRLFHTAPVRAEAWLYIVAIGVFTFAAVELEKWLRFRRDPGAGVTKQRI